MERTESKIIKVAPSFEQETIGIMESFGWSLHGRQEMQEDHKVEAEHVPARGFESSKYVIKKKIWKYVQLHFRRPVQIKNSKKIKNLQRECFSKKFHKLPSVKYPALTLGFGIFVLLALVPALAGNTSLSVLGLVAVGFIGVASVFAGYRWASMVFEKRKKISAKNDKIQAEMEEMRKQAEQLLE